MHIPSIANSKANQIMDGMRSSLSQTQCESYCGVPIEIVNLRMSMYARNMLAPEDYALYRWLLKLYRGSGLSLKEFIELYGLNPDVAQAAICFTQSCSDDDDDEVLVVGTLSLKEAL